MTVFLTEGAIRRIVDASSCTTDKDELERMRTYYPALQIIASCHPETLRKRPDNALLSDGTHSIMSSFQSTALQQSDDVQTGTIVQLFDYELSQNTTQDGRRLVVYEACVRCSARPMIGDPAPIGGNIFGLQSSDSQDDDVADNDDNIEDDQALMVAPGTSRSVMVSPARSSNSCRTSAINAAAREFLCPTSFSLPIDAVVAEDGRVYNRADIQQHIDTVQSSQNKSRSHRRGKKKKSEQKRGPKPGTKMLTGTKRPTNPEDQCSVRLVAFVDREVDRHCLKAGVGCSCHCKHPKLTLQETVALSRTAPEDVQKTQHQLGNVQGPVPVAQRLATEQTGLQHGRSAIVAWRKKEKSHLSDDQFGKEVASCRVF